MNRVVQRKPVVALILGSGALFWSSSVARGQDSVSKGGCLPGDAVAPWADAVTAGGSEQCNDYIVDLAPFAAS